jgi:hypothetical protein
VNDDTRILSAVEHGASNVAEQLLPLVHDALRHLAWLRIEIAGGAASAPDAQQSHAALFSSGPGLTEGGGLHGSAKAE